MVSMLKTAINAETLEKNSYERSKNWANFLDVLSTTGQEEDIPLNEFDCRLDDCEYSDDASEIEAAEGEEDPGANETLRDITNRLRGVCKVSTAQNDTLLKNLSLVVNSGEETVLVGEAMDVNSEIVALKDLLDQTLPVLAEHERKLKREGLDKVLNSFDVKKIEEKVGGWLRRNHGSAVGGAQYLKPTAVLTRRLSTIESNSDTDSLHSVDTARYILSSRKRPGTSQKRSKAACTTMTTIKTFRMMQSKRDALREKYAFPDQNDDVHLNELRYRRTHSQRHRKDEPQSAKQLPYGLSANNMKLVSTQPARRRKHLRRYYDAYSSESVDSDEEFYGGAIALTPEASSSARAKKSIQLCRCRHHSGSLSTRGLFCCRHLKGNSMSSSTSSSFLSTQSLKLRRQRECKAMKLYDCHCRRESDCRCCNEEKLCSNVTHLADSSTENWFVQNCDTTTDSLVPTMHRLQPYSRLNDPSKAGNSTSAAAERPQIFHKQKNTGTVRSADTCFNDNRKKKNINKEKPVAIENKPASGILSQIEYKQKKHNYIESMKDVCFDESRNKKQSLKKKPYTSDNIPIEKPLSGVENKQKKTKSGKPITEADCLKKKQSRRALRKKKAIQYNSPSEKKPVSERENKKEKTKTSKQTRTQNKKKLNEDKEFFSSTFDEELQAAIELSKKTFEMNVRFGENLKEKKSLKEKSIINDDISVEKPLSGVVTKHMKTKCGNPIREEDCLNKNQSKIALRKKKAIQYNSPSEKELVSEEENKKGKTKTSKKTRKQNRKQLNEDKTSFNTTSDRELQAAIELSKNTFEMEQQNDLQPKQNREKVLNTAKTVTCTIKTIKKSKTALNEKQCTSNSVKTTKELKTAINEKICTANSRNQTSPAAADNKHLTEVNLNRSPSATVDGRESDQKGLTGDQTSPDIVDNRESATSSMKRTSPAAVDNRESFAIDLTQSSTSSTNCRKRTSPAAVDNRESSAIYLTQSSTSSTNCRKRTSPATVNDSELAKNISKFSPTSLEQTLKPQPKFAKLRKLAAITKNVPEDTFYSNSRNMYNSTALVNDSAMNRQIHISTNSSSVSVNSAVSAPPSIAEEEEEFVDRTAKPDKKVSLSLTSRDATRNARRPPVASSLPTSKQDDCTMVTSTTEAQCTKKGILVYAPMNRTLVPPDSFRNGYFNITEEHLSTVVGERAASKFFNCYMGRRFFHSHANVYFRPATSPLDTTNESDDELEAATRCGELYESFGNK